VADNSRKGHRWAEMASLRSVIGLVVVDIKPR
jgi:hypothetical protein